MIVYFLTAYAELVAALTSAGGPQPNEPLRNIQKDCQATEDWLNHIRLNIELYAVEENEAKHLAAVAVMQAAQQWLISDSAARQVVFELFAAAREAYSTSWGVAARHCSLTEQQAMLLYQYGLIDKRCHRQTYAEWVAAGDAFGIGFSIGRKFHMGRYHIDR